MTGRQEKKPAQPETEPQPIKCPFCQSLFPAATTANQQSYTLHITSFCSEKPKNGDTSTPPLATKPTN